MVAYRGEKMSLETMQTIQQALCLVAVIFSYITMISRNWWFYIPTVIFGVATLVVGGFILFP